MIERYPFLADGLGTGFMRGHAENVWPYLVCAAACLAKCEWRRARRNGG